MITLIADHRTRCFYVINGIQPADARANAESLLGWEADNDVTTFATDDLSIMLLKMRGMKKSGWTCLNGRRGIMKVKTVFGEVKVIRSVLAHCDMLGSA